jgi:antitoxin (DNA-binding transcriptional repressor) of toxin-antitoxin stability system
MKTMSIRELRHKWPEAEKAVAAEDELIITRDGKPVAKLVRYVEPRTRHKRFDAATHLRWVKQTWGGKQLHLVDKYLLAERARK